MYDAKMVLLFCYSSVEINSKRPKDPKCSQNITTFFFFYPPSLPRKTASDTYTGLFDRIFNINRYFILLAVIVIVYIFSFL